MFPEINIDFVVTDTVQNGNTIAEYNGKTFLYDFKLGDFIYRNGAPIEVTRIEALKIWIEKVIRTERDRFKIYENVVYGVYLEDLIGTNMPKGFTESEITREITEGISDNPFVIEVKDWRFERIDSVMNVYFTVVSDFGNFEVEVIN